MLRLFAGRHKSASTWARNILHDAALALGLEIITIHVPGQWAPYPTLGDMIRDKKPDLLIMTNARQSEVDTLPEYAGVNLFRDPRDIIVSGYFSHRHSHPVKFGGVQWPELVEHRKQLQAVDKEKGLFAEIDFAKAFLDPMQDWNYANPHTLEVRMEQLVSDQEAMWAKLFAHLDMSDKSVHGDMPSRLRMAAIKWNVAKRRKSPAALAQLRRVFPGMPVGGLPTAYVDSVLEEFSFTKLSQSRRKPGESDESSHYRKGVAGDWRNHLHDAHLAYFREVHGDLVEKLGYDW